MKLSECEKGYRRAMAPAKPNPNEGHLTYKRHLIHVNKKPGGDWYILVYAPDGRLAYDGWWRGSSRKTKSEAIAEAKRGAQLQ